MKNIVIGITDCTKYEYYERWIAGEPGVQIIKLSYQEDNFGDIERCNGIMLTGGNDINPRLYYQPDYLRYCNPKDIDEKRDEFEWRVMQHTDEKQKPLLGICRGLQFVNVFFGGTLVPDIPAFGKFNHSKFKDGTERYHLVEIDRNSALYRITGQERGEVNSAHHQSTDLPGDDLVVNALSPDGIVEGMERKDPDGRAFLMLVQWHPERMNDQQSVFSKNIKHSFLDAVRNGNK